MCQTKESVSRMNQSYLPAGWNCTWNRRGTNGNNVPIVAWNILLHANVDRHGSGVGRLIVFNRSHNDLRNSASRRKVTPHSRAFTCSWQCPGTSKDCRHFSSIARSNSIITYSVAHAVITNKIPPLLLSSPIQHTFAMSMSNTTIPW